MAEHEIQLQVVETVRHWATITVDTEQWEQLFGHPYDPNEVYGGLLETYAFCTGTQPTRGSADVLRTVFTGAVIERPAEEAGTQAYADWWHGRNEARNNDVEAELTNLDLDRKFAEHEKHDISEWVQALREYELAESL